MGFTGPESGSGWLVCAAVSAFLTSCSKSRHKLWFHPHKPWYASESHLYHVLLIVWKDNRFACHFVMARECHYASVNWVKSLFRSRSVCYGWCCYAATTATNCNVWINDIRSHLPFGPGAADESCKWRCALARCTQACTECLGRPRQARCFVHPIWILFHCVRVFVHGSSVDVHRCVIWVPGYVYNIY